MCGEGRSGTLSGISNRKKPILKTHNPGAGEMSQRLGANRDLVKDLCLVLSTHMIVTAA